LTRSRFFRVDAFFGAIVQVVIRRDCLKQNPGLAATVYKGFCEAKEAAMKHYRGNMFEHSMDSMVPWFGKLLEKNSQIFPEDWWPYGVSANRKTLDTFLRYFFEQGLSKRLLTCEDMFVPELFDT
jgi:4,5-dihydroxyphthalate decarboxylase